MSVGRNTVTLPASSSRPASSQLQADGSSPTHEPTCPHDRRLGTAEFRQTSIVLFLPTLPRSSCFVSGSTTGSASAVLGPVPNWDEKW